jgi:hypothetical protein
MWISETTRAEKSDAVSASLASWISHAEEHGPLAKGLFVRKRFVQLEHDFTHISNMLSPKKATYDRGTATWTFPNGATLKMRHIFNFPATQEFRGQDFSMIIVAGNRDWPDDSVLGEMRYLLCRQADLSPKLISFVDA